MTQAQPFLPVNTAAGGLVTALNQTGAPLATPGKPGITKKGPGLELPHWEVTGGAFSPYWPHTLQVHRHPQSTGLLLTLGDTCALPGKSFHPQRPHQQ